uniref:Uncharacterized protein n=1 Tax=Quercus lobata TaxID=97700 RepID=A0A7N2N1S7_QUELO
MDSQEAEVEVEVGRTKRRGVASAVLRCTLGLVFPFILIFFALWFYVALSSSSSSTDSDSTISLPSQCKIVSSSVDLRSSQVCELGLLNYKAKNVFYPFHTNKFRCRYDYYWASVFKVEYKDHSSGQTQLAFAEAPNEALPLNCRPNFGAAWLTKDKFKVNGTYDCWYQSGISKVSLYHDGFFSCQAKDPSTIEMIRRYSILESEVNDKDWLYFLGLEGICPHAAHRRDVVLTNDIRVEAFTMQTRLMFHLADLHPCVVL